MKVRKTTVLAILDGFGCGNSDNLNAIIDSKTPNWDKIWEDSSHSYIDASGPSVGLPDGQVGNSEVGHMTMGSGRIISQNRTRIDNDIKDGSFRKKSVFNHAINYSKNNHGCVHIIGLLSNGGVHSHEFHLREIVRLISDKGLKNIYIHAILDGRDTSPKSAKIFIKKMEIFLKKLGNGQIVSILGRFYGMDRDNRWERTKRAYDAIFSSESNYKASSPLEALEMAYLRGETDEFVSPTVIAKEGLGPFHIKNSDSVVFMNFRSDRARQLSYALTDRNFRHFKTHTKQDKNFYFCTLTKYADDILSPIVYKNEAILNTFGEVISNNNLTQLRLAETEKYAHVTFFFNGGRESPFKKENRILVKSPKVRTYDLQPEMSAFEVTDILSREIISEKYDVIICNYANADMVGHTGCYQSTVKAIECLDKCLGKIRSSVEKINGNLFITSDHGNADIMLNPETGEPHTSHTTNLVPFSYIGNRQTSVIKSHGKLSDIVPTILSCMGITKPKEMTGNSCFHFSKK